MHPIVSEMHARTVMEDRRREAAAWRRGRSARRNDGRSVMDRVRAALAALGRLLPRRTGEPPRAHRVRTTAELDGC